MDGSISQASGIDPYGQAVWFWSPDAGIKLIEIRFRPCGRNATSIGDGG
jgi:hypothetical protein